MCSSLKILTVYLFVKLFQLNYISRARLWYQGLLYRKREKIKNHHSSCNYTNRQQNKKETSSKTDQRSTKQQPQAKRLSQQHTDNNRQSLRTTFTPRTGIHTCYSYSLKSCFNCVCSKLRNVPHSKVHAFHQSTLRVSYFKS